jgi:hypothetical protein
MEAEARHQVRLGLEHLPDAVVDDLVEQDLDRHLPSWHVLLVEEDVREAAGTEDVDGAEAGDDRRAGRQASHHGGPSLRPVRPVAGPGGQVYGCRPAPNC